MNARRDARDELCALRSGARVNRQVFDGATLASVRAHGLWFDRCSFTGADLRLATLDRCFFKMCSFRGATLRGASLRGASLGGCDLRDADLRDTDLTLARLGRVNTGLAHHGCTDITGADLTGAVLRDIHVEQVLGWPG